MSLSCTRSLSNEGSTLAKYSRSSFCEAFLKLMLHGLPFSKSLMAASTVIRGTSSSSVYIAMSAREVTLSVEKAGMRLC